MYISYIASRFHTVAIAKLRQSFTMRLFVSITLLVTLILTMKASDGSLDGRLNHFGSSQPARETRLLTPGHGSKRYRLVQSDLGSFKGRDLIYLYRSNPTSKPKLFYCFFCKLDKSSSGYNRGKMTMKKRLFSLEKLE